MWGGVQECEGKREKADIICMQVTFAVFLFFLSQFFCFFFFYATLIGINEYFSLSFWRNHKKPYWQQPTNALTINEDFSLCAFLSPRHAIFMNFAPDKKPREFFFLLPPNFFVLFHYHQNQSVMVASCSFLAVIFNCWKCSLDTHCW